MCVETMVWFHLIRSEGVSDGSRRFTHGRKVHENLWTVFPAALLTHHNQHRAPGERYINMSIQAVF